MKKIDRLGWAVGMSVSAYGLRIGLRANRPEALLELVERLPPGWTPADFASVDGLYSVIRGGSNGRVRRYHLLYANGLRLARTMDFEKITRAFESNAQAYVAEHSRNRVFVHAGVVGWRGRAIVLPGSSGAGKTSLVQALIKRGAVYYSDEFAVLDGRGRVHPFPRALLVRPGPRRVPPEELGVTKGSDPLSLGLVVATRYQPGVGWRPRRLSRGRGLLELLRNTVATRSRPQAVLPTLVQAAKPARFLKGRRGEADAVAEALLDDLDRA